MYSIEGTDVVFGGLVGSCESTINFLFASLWDNLWQMVDGFV